MAVFVRADASVAIGTGHVMRTLTLAERLRERGAEVVFGCRRFEGDAVERICERGFAVEELATRPNGASWLGVDLEREIADVRRALDRRPRTRLIVVDHYELDARWESAFGADAALLAIDDLADRPHDVALLVDQNLGPARRYDSLVPAAARRFLGPRYAFLRRSFLAPRRDRAATGDSGRLLVFYGGIDATGETLKAVMALRETAVPRHVDVVAPPGIRYRSEIERAAAGDPRIVVHGYVDDIAGLMDAADLALGGGGTASWERAFRGLPAIVTTLAANQRVVVEALTAAGATLSLGAPGEVETGDVRAAVDRLLRDDARRRSMSAAATGLFGDFEEAQRERDDAIFDALR